MLDTKKNSTIDLNTTNSLIGFQGFIWKKVESLVQFESPPKGDDLRFNKYYKKLVSNEKKL